MYMIYYMLVLQVEEGRLDAESPAVHGLVGLKDQSGAGRLMANCSRKEPSRLNASSFYFLLSQVSTSYHDISKK